MVDRITRFSIIGAMAGAVSFYAYLERGLMIAAFTFLVASYVLYRFSNPMRGWNTMGFFLEPFKLAFLGLFAGIFYAAWMLFPPLNITAAGLGTAFLSAAFSMLVFKYWTIGE